MASDISAGPVMVHWHEGLHLLPHHLQRLQKFAGDSVASQRLFYTRFAAGVIELGIEITRTTVMVKKLKAIMPSGAFLDLDHNTAVDTINLEAELARQKGAVVICLALPLYSDREANVLMRGEQARSARRFQAKEQPMFDETIGSQSDALPVQFLKYNARLVTEAELDRMPYIESIPLVRVQPEGRGAARLDDQYSPPLLRISGWQPLHEVAKTIVREVDLARGNLSGRLLDGGFKIDALHGDQLAMLFKLRTANAYVGRLRVLMEADHAAPWELFSDMQAMYGELMALEPGAPFEPAAYQHNSPYDQFKTLADNIVRVLEPAPTTQFLRLPFEDAGKYKRARAETGALDTHAQALLCIVAEETQSSIDDAVARNRDRFRLTSARQINFAMRGLRLLRTPAPQGLRGNPEYHYFKIDPDSEPAIWEEIIRTGEFMLDLPPMDSRVSEYVMFVRQQE